MKLIASIVIAIAITIFTLNVTAQEFNEYDGIVDANANCEVNVPNICGHTYLVRFPDHCELPREVHVDPDSPGCIKPEDVGFSDGAFSRPVRGSVSTYAAVTFGFTLGGGPTFQLLEGRVA